MLLLNWLQSGVGQRPRLFADLEFKIGGKIDAGIAQPQFAANASPVGFDCIERNVQQSPDVI